ncbi:MAG: aldehyde reductase [Halioglobus sp.]|nr:aldehyde reductase [Halioglobus sp.]
MQKKVLVTGASGFIAQQIILDLLERGYSVRGTIRDLSRAEHVRGTLAQHHPDAAGIELVQTDLEADDGWLEAATGVDHLLHVASPLPLGAPKDPQVLIRPARDGALRALRAARDAGVPRCVMTSSCAAIAYGYDRQPEVLTEEDWSDTDNTRDCLPYPTSKTLAERAAWDFVANEAPDMELATINPVVVLGPIRSADVRASVSVVAQLLGGKIMMAPNVGLQVVDVRDVSRAHIAAMEKPEAAGQRFAVAEEFFTLLQFASILAEAYPDYADKLPSRQLPGFILRFLALFSGDMKTFCAELDRRRYVSGDKAREQLLGGSYISGKDALLASAESLMRYNAIG